MSTKTHWESVYETKPAEAVSWYAPHLQESLRYVARAAENKNVAIIDVGGGESTLVDDLIKEGYSDVTVLDISATALEVRRRRK
jgi:2-polyprenyl-3-methyl-5-hydroxy-6-metoxy-1,4-benzoquinol methylase